MRRSFLACGMAFLLAGLLVPAVGARTQGRPSPEQRRGLVMKGLTRAEPGSRCAGLGYEMLSDRGRISCTHGPDPAPSGIDVTADRSARELQTDTLEYAMAGDSTADVPCIGDGQTGNRVQAIYAYGETDRSASIIPLIRTWAGANIEDIVATSALESGGSRSVRFVTTPTGDGCQLDVKKVQLSPTGLASLDGTVDELAARGLDAGDRKYVVWVDENAYCGIATQYRDDSPGTDNANNGSSWLPGSVARIDEGCWGRLNDTPVEGHEFMHTLGAVQPSAPHASAAGHCTDDNDVMCYDDGAGIATICTDALAERRFDCGKDDYFNTDPAFGSYLATHWNTAKSSFLSVDGRDICTKSGDATANMLVGTSGPDVLCGGEGNDTFRGLGGNDIFYGGPGTDTADYSNATAAIKADLLRDGKISGRGNGTDTMTGIEVVLGTPKADEIQGGEGSERLIGGGGNDFLLGWEGNDRLLGGAGADDLGGGPGNDHLDGGAGVDRATYWTARAPIVANLGTRTASGQGTDTLLGIENLSGSEYADKLTGSGAKNQILAWIGNDAIYGLGGNDMLVGSEGKDKAYGGPGDDILDGGAHDDLLYGQAGVDGFNGSTGRDRCSSGPGFVAYKLSCET